MNKYSTSHPLFHPFISIFVFVLFQFNVIPLEQNAKQISTLIEPIQTYGKQSKTILEIDSDSLTLVEEVGGGIYCQELDAIVPFFPALVRAEWLNNKNEIAERIGPIYPAPSKESSTWKSSATTIDALVEDAQMAGPYFWNKCVSIAHKTGSVANFGIANRYMIKSKKSIKRKVQEAMLEQGISEVEAISKVRDVLRGTIIADTPEQIHSIVQSLKDFAYEEGREIFFINIWEDNRPSGYVGIHAKMLLPIYDKNGSPTQRNIIIEIQIHLRCVMDGTKQCVKEREHLLYEQKRIGGVDEEIQTSASTLLYLTALKHCPKKTVHTNFCGH